MHGGSREGKIGGRPAAVPAVVEGQTGGEAKWRGLRDHRRDGRLLLALCGARTFETCYLPTPPQLRGLCCDSDNTFYLFIYVYYCYYYYIIIIKTTYQRLKLCFGKKKLCIKFKIHMYKLVDVNLNKFF